jgi:hypothetical protein
MLIEGHWLHCDDGIIRPVVECEVLAADNSWIKAEFLVDSGGDRTVLTAPFLSALALPSKAAALQLGGVGGSATTVTVDTHIRLALQGGSRIIFQGNFASFTQADALDMNVLGRDILNLFAAVIDRPGDVVCLIGQGHRYTITKQP